LCAVFIPVAFLGGIAGQLYKQFAVTVAVAVVISGFTALTLTPALCALMLREGHHESRLFAPFNRGFAWVTQRFLGGVNLALARRLRAGVGFLLVLLAAGLLFWRVPTSFIPSEDQGFLIGSIVLPDGASLQRTEKTGELLQKIISATPEIDHAFVNSGRDFIGGANKPNAATTFILLKPWEERSRTAPQVAADITRQGQGFADGTATIFNPPAIRGLGTAGGFEFYVQSRAQSDARALGEVVQAFVAALAADPSCRGSTRSSGPTRRSFASR
jgi:multidrug efflux pump subunit AcrB